MEIYDGTREIDYNGQTCVAIGKFDGVHLGHRKLIEEITHNKNGRKSLVFTFSYDSDFVYRDEDKLLGEEKRRQLFAKLGVDYLVEFKLDKQTAQLSADEFLSEILIKNCHAGEIVAGPDLSFGYKGLGNVDFVRSRTDRYGINLTVIDKLCYKGEAISSSRIRKAGKDGDSEAVRAMMSDDEQEVRVQ